jgi:hypothetical protein
VINSYALVNSNFTTLRKLVNLNVPQLSPRTSGGIQSQDYESSDLPLCYRCWPMHLFGKI